MIFILSNDILGMYSILLESKLPGHIIKINFKGYVEFQNV